MIKTVNDLENIKLKGVKSISPEKLKITVGMATCGEATGALEVYNTAVEEIKKENLDFIIAKTGCIGFCQVEPIVEVYKDGTRIFYKEVNKDKIIKIIEGLKTGNIKKDGVLCKIGDTDNKFPDILEYSDLPFYKKQLKIALRNCGFIDPDSIDEYITKNGYFSLQKALQMQPSEIIDIMIKSGLRGRGGAGFSTGLKWKFCRNAESSIKYIICNADEGDPGAYMDRSVLEGDPHSVIEGMVIGAYAMGANFGYIYVREEYPQAIEKLNIAIAKAREYGLLGKNIMGSGFDFDIKISRGAGAFVCGEETALIASLEGQMGRPRPRPPFPAQKGLFGYPTNINNVETWANVPVIIEKGSDWFAGIGTEKSKGTKVFSVVGKINNTGLVEVPMGISLQEIIFDIGGGVPGKKKFKAVQTGGPSGGCIPENLLSLPVDYEKLAEVGAIMGSGGMIVMDENTCMVDVARYFLDFLKEESCGKCVACREGIYRMLEILNNICKGKGKEEDIELLQELGSAVKDFALCALGGTASNPVLTTLKYFRNEYEAHIKDKKCPAGVCRELIEYTILKDVCTGCGACSKACPSGAITGEIKSPHNIDKTKCIKCGACFDTCKFLAVKII